MRSTSGRGGTRVGLAARNDTFIEDGLFDFGDNEVVNLAEVVQEQRERDWSSDRVKLEKEGNLEKKVDASNLHIFKIIEKNLHIYKIMENKVK